MLMVRPEPEEVERELGAGVLRCPDCEGELRPWWFARRRPLRGLEGMVPVRPRRSRCRSCGNTHVLLPIFALLRRHDLVEVIGGALVAKAAGAGHRHIASQRGLPEETVRGWLRRFAARAAEIREHFTRLAHRLGADLSTVLPRGSPVADAVEAIGVAAQAAAERFGPAPVWHFAAGASAGRLLSNTS
ncbi:MAG: helix-turn-helix domain-containing protein [Candidatus Dormibacteria bacterium]